MNYLLKIFTVLFICIILFNGTVFAGISEQPVFKGNTLKQGDCIGIVAPASGMDGMDISPAVHKLQSWGYKVKLAPNLYNQSGYLAGSDKERAADLNAFFADDEVKAILCLRGGYGSERILDLLDYEMIRQHPKMLIGYSDITALHAALWEKCRLVGVHGAMVIDINDNSPNYTDEQLRHGLSSTVISSSGTFILPENHRLEVLREGTAEGRLIGGNLSVIAALCGTPYALNGTDCILFLEEVSEDSYAIDRMMWQLWQSGILKNVKGIVIGNLRRCEPVTPQPYDYSVKQVFAHYAELAQIPVLYNLPVGHGSINGFLPLGVKTKIIADYNNPQLIITENYAEK